MTFKTALFGDTTAPVLDVSRTSTYNDSSSVAWTSSNNYTLSLDSNGNGSITYQDILDSATDTCDSSLDYELNNSSFTCADIGTTQYSLRATDDAGNISIATLNLTVVDGIAPVITVAGDNPETVELFGSYTDAGATATDNNACDGSATVSTANNLNTNAVGTYTYTYTSTDAAGNSSTATRTVNVTDTTAPAAFTTGTVTITGGTVVSGYWNSTNTGLTVVTPVASDTSLTGGTIQVQANVASGGWENLGSAYTIVSNDLSTSKTLSFTASVFEAISSGLSNGESVTFRSVITDASSNSTNGTSSSVTITVEQSLPTMTITATEVTDGSTSNNSTNTFLTASDNPLSKVKRSRSQLHDEPNLFS